MARSDSWSGLGGALLALGMLACSGGGPPPVEPPATAAPPAASAAATPVANAPPAPYQPPPPLPASLDRLYPPQAKGPALLMAMLQMAEPLEGMMVDLQEKDVEGAKTSLEAFGEALGRTAKLVPEWENDFPTSELAALRQALGSGDPRKVTGAVGALGQACGRCHAQNMARVQHKYHWPAFHTLELNDPLSGKKLPFTELKQRMSAAFAGIGNDLRQGQPDRAARQYDAFAKRFAAFKQVCKECHDSPRHYYVDPESTGLVRELGKAVKAPKPDPDKVMRLSIQIGQHICAPCHNVHVPAALSQREGGLPPAPLPASLAALYPPKAKGPALLMDMFSMSMPLEGMLVDLQEKDVAGAKANFKAFSEAVARVSKQVPEWEQYFPKAEVGALGQALGSGDPGKVMGAVGAVGGACQRCHIANMGRAQLRYHGGDFRSIEITDPLSKKKLPYVQFKMIMSSAFAGIGHDLQQGQKDRALVQYQAFKARFGAFKQVCEGCHHTPRRYYVDAEADKTIAALGKALKTPKPDPEAIAGLGMKLRRETCFKCHLVHVPGAHAQHGRGR